MSFLSLLTSHVDSKAGDRRDGINFFGFTLVFVEPNCTFFFDGHKFDEVDALREDTCSFFGTGSFAVESEVFLDLVILAAVG